MWEVCTRAVEIVRTHKGGDGRVPLAYDTDCIGTIAGSPTNGIATATGTWRPAIQWKYKTYLPLTRKGR